MKSVLAGRKPGAERERLVDDEPGYARWHRITVGDNGTDADGLETHTASKRSSRWRTSASKAIATEAVGEAASKRWQAVPHKMVARPP
jgi:hypothetical protein